MKLTVNNKEMETTAQTLLKLCDELALPAQGVAVAVNNRMMPRTTWNEVMLNDGDAIVIIKAACGG